MYFKRAYLPSSILPGFNHNIKYIIYMVQKKKFLLKLWFCNFHRIQLSDDIMNGSFADNWPNDIVLCFSGSKLQQLSWFTVYLTPYFCTSSFSLSLGWSRSFSLFSPQCHELSLHAWSVVSHILSVEVIDPYLID